MSKKLSILVKTDCFRGIGSSLCVRANNTLWRTYFHFYSTVSTQAAIMNNLCQCSRRAYSHFYDTLLKPLISITCNLLFCLDFIRVPKLVSWVVTLTFSGKTKEPECLDFKGFQAPKEQGMRESNSHQRFWRPLSYHLTNPLQSILYILSKLHTCWHFLEN